jgi:hypothetical protein
MANDKDFVVNGPVVVGKDTKVTVGTITASAIDLATGNYFDDTLAADTTYTISNAGDVQAFQLEVTGGVSGYGLTGATAPASQVRSFAAYETAPSMAAVSSDGTKVYVAGTAGIGSIVYQFTMTTAYDLTTVSGAVQSMVLSNETSNPDALAFSSDGTKMYTGMGSTVYQYTLSTAWQVNTASYDNVTLTSFSAIVGLSVSSDGSKLYVVRSGSPDSVYQYNLSTANDISTGTSAGTLSVTAVTAFPTSGGISSDGTKFYLLSATAVFELDLSTPYSITTGVYNSATFTPGFNSEGSGVSSNGRYLYLASAGGGGFRRVDMGGVTTTLTWPSSIEWAGGIAPAAPANGETDVFTFVTDDGGTTYTGVKSIDNAS